MRNLILGVAAVRENGKTRWGRLALLLAAIVLPFGSLLLVGVLAHRALRPRPLPAPVVVRAALPPSSRAS